MKQEQIVWKVPSFSISLSAAMRCVKQKHKCEMMWEQIQGVYHQNQVSKQKFWKSINRVVQNNKYLAQKIWGATIGGSQEHIVDTLGALGKPAGTLHKRTELSVVSTLATTHNHIHWASVNHRLPANPFGRFASTTLDILGVFFCFPLFFKFFLIDTKIYPCDREGKEKTRGSKIKLLF